MQNSWCTEGDVGKSVNNMKRELNERGGMPVNNKLCVCVDREAVECVCV